MNRWAEYFKDLLEVEKESRNSSEENSEEEESWEEDDYIEEEELHEALAR